MNSQQVLKQLRYLLTNQKWSGGTTPVFGYKSVLVSAAAEGDFLGDVVMPCAIIKPLGGTSDPEFREEPDYWQQLVNLRVFVVHQGDPVGQGLDCPVWLVLRSSSSGSGSR